MDCSLEEAEKRDPKGLYKKARAGEIKNFTGIDDPYEAPDSPEIHLHTDQMTSKKKSRSFIDYLIEKGFVKQNHKSRKEDGEPTINAAVF